MCWKKCEKEKKKQYTHIFRRARLLFLPQEQLYQVHTHPRWSEPPEHFEASLDTSQAVSATRSSCREILLVIKFQNSSYSLLVYTTQILLRIKISYGRWTMLLWALIIQAPAWSVTKRIQTKIKNILTWWLSSKDQAVSEHHENVSLQAPEVT